ncbi:hypothetical protein PG997_010548 [Apiospora hydei]|uniref:Rhodopsin domain-containing protein n=1 Tax=Apiospora hydei TaxID=1337664 RepID=A0ABR1VXA8_9PEZI
MPDWGFAHACLDDGSYFSATALPRGSANGTDNSLYLVSTEEEPESPAGCLNPSRSHVSRSDNFERVRRSITFAQTTDSRRTFFPSRLTLQGLETLDSNSTETAPMSGFPVVDGVHVLLPPPEGYAVDLANPQRNGEAGIYWCYAIGSALALVFLAQRLCTRVFFSGGLQLDDVFMILSWGFGQATQLILVYEFAAAIEGVHGWELTIPKYESFLLVPHSSSTSPCCPLALTETIQLSWVSPPLYVLAGSFAKLAILVVCLRLAPSGWFRACSWATVGLVLTHTVVLIFVMIFSCYPVHKSWDVSIPATEGSCIDVVKLYFATAVANIITDVILFVLPIRLVSQLRMPKVQKIGVAIIFTFASACAYLPELLGNTDQSWVISQPSLWAIIEANLIIVCGSAPTLRRFFRHVAPSLIGDSASRGKSSKETYQHDPALVTFGQISNRRNYARFGEDNEMDGIGNSIKIDARRRDVGDNRSLGVADLSNDARSDRAIITDTVTVEYDSR